jgi:hemoglobin
MASDGAPEVSPFLALGGEAGLRELIDRFYDLMDLEPRFARLRSLHPASLDGSRDKLFWYLCGFLGGPNHYIERFGHPMLRARHLPFPIGAEERDQWIACMKEAIELEVKDDALGAGLLEQFRGTADWMRNQRPGASSDAL